MEFMINDRAIVKGNGKNESSSVMWAKEQFDLVVTTPAEYKVEVEVCGNVVVAVLSKIVGDKKTEVIRSHGHIIYEGAYGVAQAASYALERLYFKLSEEE